MGRLFLRLLINTLALWLTTLILASHVDVVPFAPGGTLEFIITLVLVAVIFGLVNGIIGGIVRVVAFPLYILTLGLVALVAELEHRQLPADVEVVLPEAREARHLVAHER